MILKGYFWRMVLLWAALAAPAFGMPAADLVPGEVSLSVSAHSIHQGADAHSVIYEAQIGLTPKLVAATEWDRIEDNIGTTDIGRLYFQRPLLRHLPGRPHVAALAGVMWLSVKDSFGEKSGRTGASIGATADLPIRHLMNAYSRASVAFLDKPLWTIDLGVRYEVAPNWLLSLGYRGYDIDGSSLGGFLVSATYNLRK